MPANNGQPKNGVLTLLNTLAGSGDNWVKFGTLVLVIISGGGNFLATKHAERISEREAQQAVRELHELHSQWDDSIARQKRMEEILNNLKKNGS